MTQPKMPRPHRRPVRPSADRVRRLRELGELHREWVATNADEAGFRPDEHPIPGSDYNLHHVDLDAPLAAQDDFWRRARRIMGLDRRP